MLEKRLKVILFIRKEEEDIYSRYKGVFKVVRLKNVSNIGQTRNAILRYCRANNLSKIFMLDDDVRYIDYVYPSVTQSGNLCLRPRYTDLGVEPSFLPEAFKMWQHTIQSLDNVVLSSPKMKSCDFSIDRANPKLIYNARACIQCVYIDVELAMSNGINYRDTEFCGNEDMAFQYECMSKGLNTVMVKDLVYDIPNVGSGDGGCNKASGYTELTTRYTEYINRFLSNIATDNNRKGIKVVKSRSGIPSIKFIPKYWIKEE